MDFQSAVSFVQENGEPVNLARLVYLLEERPADASITSQLLSLQRPDGGWEPFWTTGYSSLDATCFRLAQAEALGLTAAHPDIVRAVQFLVQRQSPDGSWEESVSGEANAPPWVRPGSLQARLYRTAICGFWVVVSVQDMMAGGSAAGYLYSHLTPEGRLPSFLHANWLACGLLYRLKRIEPATRILEYLGTRFQDMESSNLAWLLNVLMVAGFDPHEPLLQLAADRLEAFQSEEGYWPGTGGPDQDLLTTLEALRVLRWLGR